MTEKSVREIIVDRAELEAEYRDLVAGMSNKRRAFVDAYLTRWSAVDASIDAGYQCKSRAHHQMNGNEVLSDPKVRHAISLKVQMREYTADMVLQNLSDLAHFNISDFFDIDPQTGDPILNLEKARERGKLHLIKSLVPGAFGWRVEFYSRQEAIALLGKVHKLFIDVQEHRGTVGVDTDITDEERAERIAELLDRARTRRDPSDS